MKFVLFVEGHTEKAVVPEFLKRYLDPRLPQQVGIQAVRFEGWAEMVKDMATRAKMYLEGPRQSEIIAVIALMDLYAPDFYPAGLRSAKKRREWATAELVRQVGQDRFRAFFAVHELEAWLLSDPKLFPAAVREALPKKVAKPETVDFDQPPAKLLERLYSSKLRRKYKKTTDGSVLFPRLDPQLVYEKCPVFQAMADELETLAKQALA